MAFPTRFGKDTTKFGGADYHAALHPYRYDTEKLKSTRQDVLAWLTGEGASTLGEGNKPGQGGLYDWIKTPELRTDWGDTSQLPLDHPHHKSKWFGAADLDASRAGGFSDPQILEWLQGRMHVLRDNNLPGKGGLYDWLSGASTDDRPDDYSNITYTEDEYVPKDPNSPKVTRNTSNYPTFGGDTINRPSRDGLKIQPRGNMIPKNARTLSSPKRKKYEQTTDLARQARKSLNIS